MIGKLERVEKHLNVRNKFVYEKLNAGFGVRTHELQIRVKGGE